ncbi:MAG: hypothetical protein ACYDAA_11120 [Syntrophales bacterium]
MKMNLQRTGRAGFEKLNLTSTAEGGCPKQRPRSTTAPSSDPSRRSGETMRDLQSYGFMEERYGIREEGIF